VELFLLFASSAVKFHLANPISSIPDSPYLDVLRGDDRFGEVAAANARTPRRVN